MFSPFSVDLQVVFVVGAIRDPAGTLCSGLGAVAFQAIALAGDFDQFGFLQEAVEDRGGGRDLSDEFAPVFRRPDKRLPTVVEEYSLQVGPETKKGPPLVPLQLVPETDRSPSH